MAYKIQISKVFLHLFLLLILPLPASPQSPQFPHTASHPPIPLHPSYLQRFQAAARAINIANARLIKEKDGVTEIPEAIWRLATLEPEAVKIAVRSSVEHFRANSTSFREASHAARLRMKGVELIKGPGETYPEVSETCINDTAAVLEGIAAKQRWAVTMLDAMGKPTPGVTMGNLKWPGYYDLCQSVRAPGFSGRYGNAYAYITVTISGYTTTQMLAIGVCFPDTCSEYDMSAIIDDTLIRLHLGKTLFGVKVPPHDPPLDTKATVAIVICAFLALCMLGGTLLDLLLVQRPRWRRQAETDHVATKRRNTARSNGHSDGVSYVTDIKGLSNGHSRQDEHAPLLAKKDTSPQKLGLCSRLLLSFSVYTNASKLLSTAQPPGSLTCVHGIRFFSMTWVVLGHGFLFPQQYGANFSMEVGKALGRWTFQAIANALVSVDSFFVLSGLLVAYLTLKEMDKRQGKLNWFMFYFHRFWRLTPAYMLVIMVWSCLAPYMGSGTFWPQQDDFPEQKACRKHWWTNLLYVNNFAYPPEEMCLGQSWYLANDMQFYCVLSPIVLIPLFYKPALGLAVSALLVLTHCLTNGLLTAHYHFAPGMYARVDADNTHMDKWDSYTYVKPYTRWGPYVIGMLAGYFLYAKKCRLHLKWHVNLSIWAVAAGSALAVLYGLYGATKPGSYKMSVSTAAFYNAVHRNVWGACVSWVVVACVTGNGGFVNTLLSWKALVPLSRLTYCIYLLHIMIMDLYLANAPALFYYSTLNISAFFLAVLVASYMAAFVGSLAFEAPMMALEKVVFPRPGDVTDKNAANDATNKMAARDVTSDVTTNGDIRGADHSGQNGETYQNGIGNGSFKHA